MPWQAPQKIVMVPTPALVCPPPPLPCIGTMAIAEPRPRGGQQGKYRGMQGEFLIDYMLRKIKK